MHFRIKTGNYFKAKNEKFCSGITCSTDLSSEWKAAITSKQIKMHGEEKLNIYSSMHYRTVVHFQSNNRKERTSTHTFHR